MKVRLKGPRRLESVPDGLGQRLLRMGLATSDEPAQVAPTDEVPLPASMAMTKAELVALAEELGVAVETDDNKAGLVAKINAAVS